MSLGDIAEQIMSEKKVISIKDFLYFLLVKTGFKSMIKEIKAQKVSGVIYVPKKYVGKRVIVIIQENGHL